MFHAESRRSRSWIFLWFSAEERMRSKTFRSRNGRGVKKTRFHSSLLSSRDERTGKFFSPSPVLLQWNWIRSSPDPQIFFKLSARSSPDATNAKSFIFILPLEAKELLGLFCLQPNAIVWRQNSYRSAFASWGKISTAFRHFQNLTRKCLLGIRGKSIGELFCH